MSRERDEAQGQGDHAEQDVMVLPAWLQPVFDFAEVRRLALRDGELSLTCICFFAEISRLWGPCVPLSTATPSCEATRVVLTLSEVRSYEFIVLAFPAPTAAPAPSCATTLDSPSPCPSSPASGVFCRLTCLFSARRRFGKHFAVHLFYQCNQDGTTSSQCWLICVPACCTRQC